MDRHINSRMHRPGIPNEAGATRIPVQAGVMPGMSSLRRGANTREEMRRFAKK